MASIGRKSSKEDSSDTPVILRRKISLFSASTIMTGIVIGSGIFVSPTSFVRHCGSVAMSLILWVVCGLLMLCIALCYTEIGAMFPKAGGEYYYYKRVIGPLPSFLFAWISLFSYYPPFYALLALTASQYILHGFFGTCQPPYSALVILSAWIVVTVVVVNMTYVEYVTRFQTFFTTVKVIGLCLIVAIGMVQLAKGRTMILASGFDGSSTDTTAYINAVYAGLFTYGGWGYVFVLLEEVKNPERVAPRATVASLAIVTVLYTLTNVAYFTVLTPEDMLSSEAVAMTFAQKTMGSFSVIMPILVACSAIGAINGSILGGSRVYFAAARDNLLPPIFSGLSLKYHTPWPSLIYTCLITILYIITGSAITLIEYIGFVGTLVTCMTVSCLLYLRYKEPHTPRPFKVPLWLAILMLVLNTFLLLVGVYHSPRKYGLGLLIVLAGIPVYWFITRCHNKPTSLIKIHEVATTFVEQLLLVHPAQRETDNEIGSTTSQ